MLSNQSKYAVRGIIYLAVHASGDHKIGSKEVGEKINVPIPFLAKTFQNLNREKLITSSKGPKGGFFLTEEQLSGNLLSVITCIDGLDALNSCQIGLPQCSDENPCAIHHLAAPMRNELIRVLEKKTIREFADDMKNGRSFVF